MYVTWTSSSIWTVTCTSDMYFPHPRVDNSLTRLRSFIDVQRRVVVHRQEFILFDGVLIGFLLSVRRPGLRRVLLRRARRGRTLRHHPHIWRRVEVVPIIVHGVLGSVIVVLVVIEVLCGDIIGLGIFLCRRELGVDEEALLVRGCRIHQERTHLRAFDIMTES